MVRVVRWGALQNDVGAASEKDTGATRSGSGCGASGEAAERMTGCSTGLMISDAG